MTPARPPAAEVPGADEESPEADPSAEGAPAAFGAEATAEAESMAVFTEDFAADQEPDCEAGDFEPESRTQSEEQSQQPEPVTGPAQAAGEGLLEDVAAGSGGDQEADSAAPQDGVEEEASSTAWRSFTAAERRRREARP